MLKTEQPFSSRTMRNVTTLTLLIGKVYEKEPPDDSRRGRGGSLDVQVFPADGPHLMEQRQAVPVVLSPNT